MFWRPANGFRRAPRSPSLILRGSPLPDRIQTLHNAALRAEVGLCIFFQSTITLMLGGLIVILFLLFYDQPGKPVWLFVVLAVLWIVFDLPAFFQTWFTAIRGPGPTPVTAALRQPLLPLAMRPLPFLWWMTHFLFGCLVALDSHTVNPTHSIEPVLVGFIGLCNGLAANAYLVLAVASLTHSETACRRVWSARAFIDLGVGAVAFLISVAHK
jgi:hypothetical protein